MNKNKVATNIKELDKVLGGGFPKGRLVHIYGSSSIGKSTLVYKILGATGGFSCLIDTECCFNGTYAKSLGVALHNLIKANIRDYSKVFEYLLHIIKNNCFKYIIVDSIAGIADEKIYELIKDKLPIIIKELEKQDCVLIFTNQVRGTKVKKAAHGAFINACSSVILHIKDKYKTKEGFESTIEVKKNKYGFNLGSIKLKLNNY